MQHTHLVWARRAKDRQDVGLYLGQSGSEAEAVFKKHRLDGQFLFVKWCPQVPHFKQTTPARDGLKPFVQEKSKSGGKKDEGQKPEPEQPELPETGSEPEAPVVAEGEVAFDPGVTEDSEPSEDPAAVLGAEEEAKPAKAKAKRPGRR